MRGSMVGMVPIALTGLALAAGAELAARADPAHRVPIDFVYNFCFPEERVARLSGWRCAVAVAGRAPLSLATLLFPAQVNVFAFLVDKHARELRSWMESGERMRQGAAR